MLVHLVRTDISDATDVQEQLFIVRFSFKFPISTLIRTFLMCSYDKITLNVYLMVLLINLQIGTS